MATFRARSVHWGIHSFGDYLGKSDAIIHGNRTLKNSYSERGARNERAARTPSAEFQHAPSEDFTGEAPALPVCNFRDGHYTQFEARPRDNLRIDTAQDQELPSARGFRFAIVASLWNDSLMARLVEGALEALKESEAENNAVEIFRVPGSFEIPLCALKAAESGKFDAVICLGVIIRGDTPHFDYVAAETARGINEAGLRTGIPLLFGVITADNVEQANARAGAKRDNKGYDAALAAVAVVNLYRERFGR